MADDNLFLIKIDIAKSKNTINSQMKEIQTWFTKNHKLDIDLNLNADTIKGLDRLSQLSKETITKIRNESTKSPIFDFEKPNAEAQKFLRTITTLTNSFQKNKGQTIFSYDEFGKLNVQVEQANGLLKKYELQWDSLTQKFKTQNIKINDNSNSILEKQLQLQQKITKEIEKQDLEQQKLTQQTEHWLSIQQKDFESKTLKFTQQRSGLYNENELLRLQKEFASLTPNTENLKQKVDNLNASFRRLDAEAVAKGFNSANKHAMSFGESVQTAAYKMGIWLSVGNLFFGMIEQFKQSLDFISEMDKGITNLRLEMSNVNIAYQDVTKTANEYALAMGSTTKSVMKGIEVFGTYTSTMDEILKKSQAAIVLSNITGKDISQMSDDLMGTMAQFDLVAEDSMHVVDVISGTARQLQVDYPKAVDEISKGLRTVGSVAKESKIPIELLSSMIGTLSEKTRRSGTEIANSLRTIFGRVLNVGEDADPESFKKVERQLDALGIKIREIGGDGQTLRPVGDILSDLASQWDTLSDAQRQSIAFDAAGMYRKNTFITLMQNYSDVLTNNEAAINSNGVALQKQDIYMDSLQAHTREFVAVLEQMYLSLSKSDTLKGIVDIGTNTLKVFANLSDTFGTIPVALATITAGISLFSTKFREGIMGSVGYLKVLQTELIKTENVSVIGIDQTKTNGLLNNLKNFQSRYNEIKNVKDYMLFENTSSSVSKLGIAFEALTGRTLAYTAATIGARIATIAWQATLTLGLSLAISAVMTGIINLTQRTQKQKEAFDILTKSIHQLKSETTEIPNLISQYENLSTQANLTADEKSKLADATQRLSSLFPDSVSGLNAEGKAASVDIEYIKQLTKAKQELLVAQQQELGSKFNSMGDSQLSDIQSKQKEIDKLNQKILKENNQISRLQNDTSGNDYSGYIKSHQENITKLSSERAELLGEINETKSALAQEAYAFDQSSDSVNKLSQGAILNLISNLPKASVSAQDLRDKMQDLANSGFDSKIKDFNNQLVDMGKQGKSTADMQGLVTKAVSDLSPMLISAGYSADEAKKRIEELLNIPTTTTKESVSDVQKSIDDLNQATEDYLKQQNDLAEVVAKVNDGHKLTAEEIYKLVKAHPELASAITNENGLLGLNKEALEKVMEANDAAFKSKLQSQKVELENQATALKQKLLLFGQEVKGIKSVADAYRLNNELLYGDGNDKISREMAGRNESVIRDLEAIENQLKVIGVVSKISPSSLVNTSNPNLNKSPSKDSTSLSDILSSEQWYLNAITEAENKNKSLAEDEYDKKLATLKLEEQAEQNLINYYNAQRAIAKSKGLEAELNEKILSAQGKLIDLEKEREQINEKILEIKKAEQNLSNAKKEKNTRVLVGNDWEWQADPKAIREALEELHKLNPSKYAEGGEIKQTGLQWFDGTLSKPERVLSPEQTEAFNKLVKDLPTVTNIMSRFMTSFKVPNITPISKTINNTSGGVTIENVTIVTPNVDGFASELQNRVRLTNTQFKF